MTYTFDSVLDDDVVTIVHQDDIRGVFEILIGDLKTPVTIELWRFFDRDQIKFLVSHAIKTPLQAGPYRTSYPIADDPEYALHRAVSFGLTQWYREAVDAGHVPNEDWLVPY